ncbi:Hypothetical protein I595_405 [Croceitalea dokdonensis DOKDO 023]|uniref:Uncharacterized protein n=1 Tax=Croceitalea dokdonensis DOKDO 023 TaxID=1300341 RepID=A0A0P7B2B2_9FLAO|nr:hypothetical protein [Croceitalea dokdonensis]KPM33502.1 Hypothetical protein I595_405 [Croceitalea dokdonensis DOKDO 023]
MKIKQLYFTVVASFLAIGTFGQTAAQSELQNETKEKTYTFTVDGNSYENSVKINTVVRQAVMTELEDKYKVNGDRIFPPKVVVKKVWIDLDKDFEYDEFISFSYMTEDETDFTLMSSPDKLVLAVDKGESTTILNNMSILKEKGMENNDAYVFTMNDGKRLELKIEDYRTMKRENSK